MFQLYNIVTVEGAANARRLAGNHEYLGLRVLGRSARKTDAPPPWNGFSEDGLTICFLWMNGGGQTLSQLRRGWTPPSEQPYRHGLGYRLEACCLEMGEGFCVEAKKGA